MNYNGENRKISTNQVVQISIIDNKQNCHYASQYGGEVLNITFLGFLPKMVNLNIIMRNKDKIQQ